MAFASLMGTAKRLEIALAGISAPISLKKAAKLEGRKGHRTRGRKPMGISGLRRAYLRLGTSTAEHHH